MLTNVVDKSGKLTVVNYKLKMLTKRLQSSCLRKNIYKFALK